mmetsp:Transcript_6909/g.22936  ORF Transcript_6909/g.22936 Transcript_6909/m.22936 type:complete len:290 (-) Transcript_6909:66-935(-)
MQVLSRASLAKPLSAGRQSRSRAASRFVVRAEEEKAPAPAPAAEETAVEAAEAPAPPPVKAERDPNSLMFGGIGASKQSLAYLDGSLPGDKGFDPLGLSDPDGAAVLVSPGWLAYAEVIHARWAMIASAGVVVPEALGKMGIIPAETGLVWFKSGVIPPLGEYSYWADPYTLFFGMITLMGFAEMRRLGDYRNPGSMSEQWFYGIESIFAGSGNPSYPGGQFFNAVNLDSPVMKEREIKNGRLAMISMVGYWLQAIVTGEGPVENLVSHVADPLGSNFFSSLSAIGGSF